MTTERENFESGQEKNLLWAPWLRRPALYVVVVAVTFSLVALYALGNRTQRLELSGKGTAHIHRSWMRISIIDLDCDRDGTPETRSWINPPRPLWTSDIFDGHWGAEEVDTDGDGTCDFRFETFENWGLEAKVAWRRGGTGQKSDRVAYGRDAEDAFREASRKLDVRCIGK